MSVGAVRNIDWGVLTDAGQEERAMAILGEDTPWTRLRVLSTFRYHAHQAVVADQEEEEPLPDIEFQLCGQHFEMTIERFFVMIDIYYEPETVTDAFVQGLAQGEVGVMRAWWPQISTA
ncbi:hypothetical protein R6Q57_011599 [Mikania cordata]